MAVVIEKLKAEKKSEKGSGVSGRLRAEGRIPAVVYGEGMDVLQIHVPAQEIWNILNGPRGRNTPVELDIEGEKILTLPREVQQSPVKPELIHIDFIKVDKDKRVQAEVPIHLTGTAEGVKTGGRLGQYEFSVLLEAPSINIPAEITYDITSMEVDDKLMLSELVMPDGVTNLRAEEDILVAQVFMPNLEAELEQLEADLEADLAAEGEDAVAGADSGDDATGAGDATGDDGADSDSGDAAGSDSQGSE